MRQIQLSQGQFALVDDEDFEWLSAWKWYACRKNAERNVEKWYARRHETRNGKRVTIYMHREVMKTPPHQVVDHAPDTSGLNNQKSNLTNVSENKNLRHCRFRKSYAPASEPCL